LSIVITGGFFLFLFCRLWAYNRELFKDNGFLTPAKVAFRHNYVIVCWQMVIVTTAGTGAFLEGLIGKSGANPARSRHCNSESALQCHWKR
jgi:hypothetical protein